VIVFAGELLQLAESLIHNGLHPADIVSGYEKAAKKALEFLDGMKEPNPCARISLEKKRGKIVTFLLLAGMSVQKVEDPRNHEQVTKALRSVISAKQYPLCFSLRYVLIFFSCGGSRSLLDPATIRLRGSSGTAGRAGLHSDFTEGAEELQRGQRARSEGPRRWRGGHPTCQGLRAHARR
jgi:hypothetical protein